MSSESKPASDVPPTSPPPRKPLAGVRRSGVHSFALPGCHGERGPRGHRPGQTPCGCAAARTRSAESSARAGDHRHVE